MRIVLAAVAVFAALYVALDLNALYALRANQNTGLYLQSLVDFVQTGSTFDQPDAKPHMLVHNQWIVYALLAPVIRVWPRPETLIIAQNVALATAAIPLFYLAREFGVGRRGAELLAIAFLIAPSMQGWAYDGFVGEDLVPVVAFSLALAARRRSLLGTLACAEILLGIKEDQVWFLAWFAALGFIFYDRRIGLAVFALAIVNGALYYAVATHLGYVPERPRYGVLDREWPQQLTFLLEVLVPLGFAPMLLRWRLLAALPLFVELFFTQNRTYPLYHTGSYYTVPLVVVAMIATAYVAAATPNIPRIALTGAVLMAIFFNNASVLHLGRRLFSLDPQYAAARSWATTSRPVDIPCEDVGAWTVASPNLNARLTGCGTLAQRHTRPAWQDQPLNAIAPWTLGAPRS